MTIDTLDGLLAALRDSGLLDDEQLAQLPALAVRFADPAALAGDLERLGWLTVYQAEELRAGRGGELVLGQYVIQSLLGQGGMGKVFKARHRLMKRVVAVKVIRPTLLAEPRAVSRFHREIEAVSRLSHPNIVAAFDANQVGNTHFLVMEYVEGTDLARLVKEHGPLPTGLACDCVRQAALGLQHAFEKGMVHRDIKPSNLMLTRAYGLPPARLVKVLDMGLARLHAEEGDGLTHTGAVMGTPDYIAPEQATDAHLVDIRADLYSLGCTLYFLLTGEPPFPGGTSMEKLFKHRYVAPRPVAVRRPEVPPAVAAVVAKLMAKRPEERYQTPAELAEALAPLSAYNPNDEATTIFLPPPPAEAESESGTIRGGPPAAETMHPEGAATRLEGDATRSGKSPGDWSASPVPYVEPASPAGAVPAVAAEGAAAPPRRRAPVLLAGVLMLVGAVVVVGAVALPSLWQRPSGGETFADGDGGRAVATAQRNDPRTTYPEPRETPKGDTGKEAPKTTGKESPKDTGKPPPPSLLPQGVVAEIELADARLAAFGTEATSVVIASQRNLYWYDLTSKTLGTGTSWSRQVDPIDPKKPSTYAVAITRDGKRVFYGNRTMPDLLPPAVNALRLWITGGSVPADPIWTNPFPMLDISCIAISGNEKLAVTGTADRSNDTSFHASPTLLIWDLNDLKSPKIIKNQDKVDKRFTGHKEHAILSVALSQDGRRAVSSAEDDTVRWWEVENVRQRGAVSADAERVPCVAIAPAGDLIFYGDERVGRKSLHAVPFEQPAKDLIFEGEDAGTITAIAVATDGSQVIAGTQFGVLQLWSVKDGKLLHTWNDTHSKKPVLALALSPDGNYAYSVGADNRICRWHIPAGKRRAEQK